MLEYAIIIIEDFEKNVRCATNVDDYREEGEEIMLYLAAKRYVDVYN